MAASGLDLYRGMYLTRSAEKAIQALYFENDMKTPMHMSMGAEAIEAGICAALGKDDRLFGTYRSHGLYLCRTGETDLFLAEMYGRATGINKGRSGSMHLIAPEAGLMGTSAIVASCIPVASGSAFADMYLKTDKVSAVFFGDGAIDEGVFFESVNFAALKGLPALFVCEDNEIAVHSHSSHRHGYENISAIVANYDIIVESSDSTDVEEIYWIATRLLAKMRAEKKPGFLHLKYYRYLEHVGVNEDFSAGYRPKAEYEAWLFKDPVALQRTRLVSLHGEGVVAELERKIDSQVSASCAFAKSSPHPERSAAFENVILPPSVSSALDVDDGRKGRSITYQQAVNEALTEEMARDEKVFIYGIDVADHKRIFGSSNGLLEKFGPNRCFSTPLSEDAMSGVALGAALAGLRPVHVHMRVDFMILAMNQIANMIASTRYGSGGVQSVPVTIRAIIGRGWGQAWQHSKTLFSAFAHIPGLKVVAPATPRDAKGMLKAAIRDDNPTIVFEHRWLYFAQGELAPDDSEPLSLEGCRVLREGSDLTILAVSWMCVEAMKAAEVLADSGISVEVIDVRSLAPFDLPTVVASVRKTGRLIVADYDWIHCGFSAEAAAGVYGALSAAGELGLLKSPIERIGFADTHCPCARPLENAYYPDAITLLRKAEAMLGATKPSDISKYDFYSYENKFKGPF